MSYIPKFSRQRRSALRLIGALTTTLAAGCADNPTKPPPPPSSQPAPVASIEVSPDAVHLEVGDTHRLSATPRAQDGRPLQSRSIEWTSSNETIVRVDNAGNVTALRQGRATITATSEGKQGEARVEVAPEEEWVPPAVASVQIIGGNVEIEPWEVFQLGVTLLAADGTVLTGRQVTWTSSDTSIVIVNYIGALRGRRTGTVTITATSEGKSAQTTVRVPEVVRHDLGTVDGRTLPTFLLPTYYTNAQGVTVERRVKVLSATLERAISGSEYRQEFRLEVWEKTQDRYWFGDGLLVAEPVEQDRGTISYDRFSGEPIFQSADFAGHSFTMQQTDRDLRAVRQAIPGQGPAAYDLSNTLKRYP